MKTRSVPGFSPAYSSKCREQYIPGREAEPVLGRLRTAGRLRAVCWCIGNCPYVRLSGYLERFLYELAGTSRPAHCHLCFVVSVLAEVRRGGAYHPGLETGR